MTKLKEVCRTPMTDEALSRVRALIAKKCAGIGRNFHKWEHMSDRAAFKAVDCTGKTLAVITGRELFAAIEGVPVESVKLVEVLGSVVV
jgi:hypothetical protein